jgi:hypothetical protein
MFIRIQLLLFLIIVVFLIYWLRVLVYHTHDSGLALRPETPTCVIAYCLNGGLLVVLFELEYGRY